MRSLLVTSLAVAFVAMPLVACSLASPTYITAESGESGVEADAGPTTKPASTPATGDTPASATCGTDDWDKPDVASLTACGNGKGHCIDKTKIDAASMFDVCPDGKACVPDEFIALGGTKLKTCKVDALGGAAGGCITIDLVPQMKAQGGSFLKQDACDAGQVCAPCTDPTHNNAPTPFCLPEGVHKNACSGGGAAGDAGTAPAAAGCCTKNGKSNGLCLPESAIPASNKEDVHQQECAAGTMCVPASMASGAVVKCTTTLAGAGVCMDRCFNDMMSTGGDIGIFSSKGCGSTELCIPCSIASLGGTQVPGCQ